MRTKSEKQQSILISKGLNSGKENTLNVRDFTFSSSLIHKTVSSGEAVLEFSWLQLQQCADLRGPSD